MENESLLERRQRVMGPGYYTYYDDPVHIVRGEGVWLWDADGKQYLDCYNNVPSVGHCHPRVVEAMHNQALQLNTHTRYLHEGILEFAELLTSKFPEGLNVCKFVCTGSEANDLALQIAEAVSGNNGHISSADSYHGNTKLIRTVSTYEYEPALRPEWLRVVEPPDLYRGPYREDRADPAENYAAQVDEACRSLAATDYGVASIIIDSIYDQQGPYLAPPGYAKRAAERVREAGGLVIADEVQAGYARTGRYWWGFEHGDMVPDIVTLGKPMGNGHPLACVITTAEIAARFADTHWYFNTYGGNPVSMAVGKAVVEVIDDERLQRNVDAVSVELRSGLLQLADRYDDIVGQVTGAGLFLGVDMVTDPRSRAPMDKSETSRLISAMARAGVLIGSTGRHGNVLKIRPPLVFSTDNVDQVLTTLDLVLARYRRPAS